MTVFRRGGAQSDSGRRQLLAGCPNRWRDPVFVRVTVAWLLLVLAPAAPGRYVVVC